MNLVQLSDQSIQVIFRQKILMFVVRPNSRQIDRNTEKKGETDRSIDRERKIE